MINQIKKEQLEARKSKNKFKSNILTALISEITAIGKNDGNRDTTESEALNIIKKFKKNVGENVKLTKDEEKIRVFNEEIQIYDSFLPKQMSERETEVAIEAIIVELENPNMGLIMKELKTQYGDKLDMQITSKLVKNKIS